MRGPALSRADPVPCASPAADASSRFAAPRSSRWYYDDRNYGFPQQLNTSRNARFRESSLCILELGPRCLSPLRSWRRVYLSLRRTELDVGLRTRNQASRPVHACEPAPRCCQNFTCPPHRRCRRARQKINEVSRMAMEADVALRREGDLNMRASGSRFCWQI